MSDNHDNHEIDGIREDRKKNPPTYYLILLAGLVIWAIGYMGYHFISGWNQEDAFAQRLEAHKERTAQQQGSEPQAAPASNDPASIKRGKDLYDNQCAMCHGQGGGGGFATDLTIKSRYKYGFDRDAVFQSIREGRPGGMPSSANLLSQRQIDDITNYVISVIRE
ncbi:cytochrome c class I [Desulfurispirillum indicum S5]|uniref:Cytochrome c class I n=1 Tax=Desulfurispirillum indicum (strain ATCC BAA-1389 / DSM 22839 / S5) TaxID=653733 RepID=E6W3B0_DESIS|nr:c-type cytochrome [Desulfurispirillum indicum]ADU66864.1 cytochrome c class I [Desulfurispirillum indicum S5]